MNLESHTKTPIDVIRGLTESHWREQIAQEIEAKKVDCAGLNWYSKGINEGIDRAANIARGK